MQIINVDQELARWRRTFRVVIATTRIDADISQEELARRLHGTRNTIANIEGGRRGLQAAELPIIAKALSFTPEELFRWIMMWSGDTRHSHGAVRSICGTRYIISTSNEFSLSYLGDVVRPSSYLLFNATDSHTHKLLILKLLFYKT